jgi:nicotinamidase-related amidase
MEQKEHEWAENLNGQKDSLNDFFNHYLEKTDPELDVIKDGKLKFLSNQNNVLFVIDMQNDFVKPSPEGAFSVADGVEMAPKLLNFINVNKEYFSKIIVSRDTHDLKHCSFVSEDGIFPTHCVINTPGAELYKGFEQLNALPNIDVIFKGMDPTADSFGAVTYEDSAYYKGRYSGKKCCNTNDSSLDSKCTDATGGFYLKDKSDNFKAQPFCENCEVYPEIKDAFGEKFVISDILKNEENTTNIFVVGLAGDFCCKDTAINLALQAKASGRNNINVYVIQEFVRYAFLPCKLTQITSDSIRATDGIFSNYVFQPQGNGFRILSKQEARGIDNDKLKEGLNYFNFLNNPKDIVDDYSKYGVKLLMNSPTFQKVIGGRRTRKALKKKKTLKINKPKKYNTRKMNKSKKRRLK